MIFGAYCGRSEGHRYRILPPVRAADLTQFERRNGIELPLDYRTFLEVYGAGGAGPFYGILDFREAVMPCDVGAPWPVDGSASIVAPDDDPIWRWPGLTYICHEGCAIEDHIELNGADPGRMWSIRDGETYLLERFHGYFDKWLKATDRYLKNDGALRRLVGRVGALRGLLGRRLTLEDVTEVLGRPHSLYDPSRFRSDLKGELWAVFDGFRGRVRLNKRHQVIRVDYGGQKVD